jgi:hypothetical protein
MLKSVHLKNFKLHEDTLIEAAPITVFIGPNNSGKSSIFQALLALRQAMNSPIHPSRAFISPLARLDTGPGNPFMYVASELVNIGEFADVARGGRGTLAIGVAGGLESTQPLAEVGPVQVNLEVRVADNSLSYHEGELFGSYSLKWVFLGQTEPSPEIVLSTLFGRITFAKVPGFQLLRVASVQARTPDSPELQRRLQDTGNALAGAPGQLLNSLHHVSAIRGFEEWGYPLPEERAQSLERICLPDRAVALVTTIASNARLKKQLSDRLSDLLKIGLDIEFVGGSRVKVFANQEKRTDGQRLFVNEGTGANQLPFILVPIALTPAGETILLSEPEVHLHPERQCELTRMLLKVAKKESIQFFIETHSEHVLHVILNAIARHEWLPSEVAIYYFENVNGTAKTTRLEVDEQGGVKGGLPGFFDQSLDELTEYLESLKKPTA